MHFALAIDQIRNYLLKNGVNENEKIFEIICLIWCTYIILFTHSHGKVVQECYKANLKNKC